MNSEKVTDSTPIPPPDWEVLISVIADEILAERSPAQILLVRSRLYDLLTHCIPPTTILKVWPSLHAEKLSIHREEKKELTTTQTLTFKLIAKVDDALKPEVIQWSAFYEHRVKQGSVRLRNYVTDKKISSNYDTESDFPPRGICREIHAHLRKVRHLIRNVTELLMIN